MKNNSDNNIDIEIEDDERQDNQRKKGIFSYLLDTENHENSAVFQILHQDDIVLRYLALLDGVYHAPNGYTIMAACTHPEWKLSETTIFIDNGSRDYGHQDVTHFLAPSAKVTEQMAAQTKRNQIYAFESAIESFCKSVLEYKESLLELDNRSRTVRASKSNIKTF